jgi:hypothetical protein
MKYLVTDNGIEKIVPVDGVYTDSVGQEWPDRYLVTTAQDAVAKFTAYQTANAMRQYVEKAVGKDLARELDQEYVDNPQGEVDYLIKRFGKDFFASVI